MHWYHFTGIKEFHGIVSDGALLAFYERLKRHCPNKAGIIENLKSGGDEDFRRSVVFLTQDNDRLHADARARDVCLDFELDRSSNYHGHLVVPELSLDFLARVYSVRNHLDFAKLILNNFDNGKYGKIPVRSMV